MASAEQMPGRNITLSWIVRLRWGAVAGQTFTVLAASLLLGLALPVVSLLSVIGVTVLTNLALDRWIRGAPEAPPGLIASVLVLDTLLLTLLLMLAGGPENPFSALFLVHVTLAAVTLGARWGWGVTALSAACFLLLFAVSVPLSGGQGPSPDVRRLHLAGTWIAYLVAATVTAYFVSRIMAELKRRDVELAEAKDRVVRGEKLASLTALAAGAAHELGTPLGTIAVVARELERESGRHSLSPSAAEDLRLIREQVERCRLILVQMSAKAGETMGETPGPVSMDDLVAGVRAVVGGDRASRLEVVVTDGASMLDAPRQALVQVLASLVRNGFDACAVDGTVRLAIAKESGRVRITVSDGGAGMAPDVLARAGDPFFTTKAPGQGTGLGLFLARAFAERLGGSFAIESAPSKGTTVSLELPDPARFRSDP